VDTHYDPDPQTSHDEATESATAKDVLARVLRNEGADVAAHDMIRREQHEAESMERLSAEYLTLAMSAQSERWDALLVCSGLTPAQIDGVRSSEAHGPLLAALREAEACGLDIEVAFPQLVAGRSLTDALDVAAVLHGRVDRWKQAASGGRRVAGQLVAGLIPRVRGITDPEMARALAERDQAMESRARTLANQAIETRQGWVQLLGPAPNDPGHRARWLREVSTIAAYRDRWHFTGSRPVGSRSDDQNTEQMHQRQLAFVAAEHARAIAQEAAAKHPIISQGAEIDVVQGVER
jgi:hypothetical protein